MPEGSGDTIFELDETENRLHMPTVKLKFFEPNMYNSEKAQFKAETGKLLFFPSRLRHSVTKNKTNQNRYTIAMNFFFKGDTSDGQNKLILKMILVKLYYGNLTAVLKIICKKKLWEFENEMKIKKIKINL